ncbi:MAG: TIGR02147 family protein [Pseudobdellovibrio sp.]
MSYLFTEDHREYIKRELTARVRRRPLYSQRAFARDLGVAPSTLTDFLKGRSGFSSGRISQLSKQLGLSFEQKEHWADLVDGKFNRDLEKRKQSLIRIKARLEAEKSAITSEEFKTISEWHHFAFLELIELNSKKYSDIKTAAKSLKIPVKILKEAVQRLLDLKLLKINDIEIFEVDATTNVGNQIPSEGIRYFHQQILDKALMALDNQDMKRRFNSSTMVGLPKSKIPIILEELKSMSFKILEPHLQTMGNESKEELYCLSIQFFDLLNSAQEKI